MYPVSPSDAVLVINTIRMLLLYTGNSEPTPSMYFNPLFVVTTGIQITSM